MLSPNELLYAQARVKGLNKEMAAIAAGFEYEFASKHGGDLEENEEIREYIKRYIAVKISEYQIIDKLDPKEYLESILNDKDVDKKTKIAVAYKLLPFTQKKERTPAAAKKTKREEQEEALQKTEKGQFGQSQPPLRAVK